MSKKAKPKKLFVISDVHLDAVTDGVPRFDEIVEAVNHVAQRCALEDAGFVFGGDLCDPDAPNAHRCTGFAAHIHHQLEKAGVEDLWLNGNHDVIEDGYCTSTLEPVRGAGGMVIACPSIETVNGIRIGCLPYAPKTHSYDPVAIVDEWRNAGEQLDIVLGHLNAKGVIPGSESHDMPRGRDTHWPLDILAQAYPDVPLIAGHYHRGECVGPLHIVGSPARFTHSESTNVPSYLEIELQGGPTPHVSVVRHAFSNTRRIYSVNAAHHIAKAEKLAVNQGDIVRMLVDGTVTPTQQAFLADNLARAGVASVRVKSIDHADAAPIDLAERPDAATVTAEDGFATAKRLAEEWPSADEEFRTELTGLVAELAEQSR